MFAEALGVRYSDELGVHDLKHAHTQAAHQDGRHCERGGQPGQHKSLEVAADAAASFAHRQQVQVDRKDLYEHDAEPEGGQGQPDDGNSPDDVVGQPVLARRRQGRQWHGDDNGKGGGHTPPGRPSRRCGHR